MIFAIVGLTWFLWLLTDILWEIMVGLRAYVLPHLKSTNTDLISKYGTWAGKYFYFFE